MHEVWREYGPPVYVAVAAYLGLNKPDRTQRDVLDAEDLANFLSQFPGAVAQRTPD